ncbi:MAG: DPP IV N-terminal domain-containing protein [Bacteroidales bacterium]|nr:DPP IV N-terminal domain-containing protein [Bacteroidales bacterium]
MKKIIFFVLNLSLCLNLISQKADFKAAEKFRSDNITSRIGDLSVNPNWIEESDLFWYSYKTSSGKKFYYVDAQARSKQLLFDSRYMASELKKLTLHPYNELDLPVKELKFEKKSTTKFTFQVDSIRFLYDMNTRRLVIKDTVGKEKKPSWASYSPDSTWIAYAKNHNLFLMKTGDKDSAEIQLTTDGERYYSFAGSSNTEDTAKNIKVRARVSWFKNEKKFYVIREDERKVKDLFVIDVLSNPRPKLESYRYSMPGEEFVPQPELIIFDVASGKRTDVDLKKWKDQTISIAWSSQKDADKLIAIRKDRPLKNLDVCLVDAETGKVSVLFSEEAWPYFNNEYSRLSVLNEGGDIIWWSERTGWGQLYLYDKTGKMKRQITDGYFVAGRINHIDTLSRILYFEAFGREEGTHPYYSMKYKASLDKPGMSLVTREPANHSLSMSKSSKYFVDTYSTVDSEPESVLRDNNGNIILNLEKADLSQLYQMGWKMPQTIKVKAKDGVTDLYGVMYTPFKLDSTRKYPVISYVYPGPQTESVPCQFTATGGKNIALAQLGFVVVNFGHRGGSPQRSNYYHTYGYDNLRDYALTDDVYGLEQLSELYPFIDIERVGIYGHSGGGFMSTAAILSHPDFYDVAVSSAGNHDNNIYNQWWGETHDGVEEVEKKVKVKTDVKKDTLDLKVKMDTTIVKQDTTIVKKETEKAEKAFRAGINKNQDLAKNLKGHLLLVHGDIDNNVHPGNTLRVADALIKANKRFDFMMLPGQRHGFGNATAYFDRMMWYYFAEHLLEDYRTNVDLTDF